MNNSSQESLPENGPAQGARKSWTVQGGLLGSIVGGLAVAIILAVAGQLWRLPAMSEKLDRHETEIRKFNERFSDLASRLATLETRTALQQAPTPGQSKAKQDSEPKRAPDQGLTKINMNTANDLHNIKVSPGFHVEWDRGPASKVFQVYKDGLPKPIFEKHIMNGELVSLPSTARGQVELKTWWDDGTREREEGVWVFVVTE